MKRTKFIALMMALTMLFSSMTAFAADANDRTDPGASKNVTVEGELEDYVNKDVFRVVLPTQDHVDFTLDPQGLLNVADSTTYTEGKGAVYFRNESVSANSASANSVTYSNTSDAFEVINKSSYAVNVGLSVKATLPQGVSLVKTEGALATATSPSVYLAVQEDGGAAKVLASGDNYYDTVEVTEVPESTVSDNSVSANGYYIQATPKVDGSGYTYAYVIGDVDIDTLDRASYTMTGACDQTADWSKVNALANTKEVKAELVWTVTKHTVDVSVTTAGVVTIAGLTPGLTIKGVYMINAEVGSYEVTDIEWNTDNYTAENGGTIVGTIGSEFTGAYSGKETTIGVVLSDQSTIFKTVTMD